MLRNEMQAVYTELSRLRNCSEMGEFLAAKVNPLTELFIGITGKARVNPLEQEDNLINTMERR